MKKTATKPRKKAKAERNSYTAEHRDKARKYYLMGLTLPEVSKLLNGISTRTLEKWQHREQWTALKEIAPLKQKVLELHNGGHSYSQIAEMLKIHRVTVWRWLKKAKQETE